MAVVAAGAIGAAAFTQLTRRGPTEVGPASKAVIDWQLTDVVREEHPLRLSARGRTNGHVFVRAAALNGATHPHCPQQPVIGSSLRPLADTPARGDLNRAITHRESLTPTAAGSARICAWVLARDGNERGDVVATLDRTIRVRSAKATLATRLRTKIRAGRRFRIRTLGVTSAPGRRIQVLAVPVEQDAAPASPAAPSATPPTEETASTTPSGTTPAQPTPRQRCRADRRQQRGKLRVQVVASVTAGRFTRALRVRFPFHAVGSYRLCVQVIERDDPIPEAVLAGRIQVSEARQCTDAKAVIAARRKDLSTVRRRLTAARQRLVDDRRTARAATSKTAGREDGRSTRSRYERYLAGETLMEQMIARIVKDSREYCVDL